MGDKFDKILKRMLESKPLSKAEISARIKAEREARKGKPAKSSARKASSPQ